MNPFRSPIHGIIRKTSKSAFDIPSVITACLLWFLLFLNITCFADGIPVTEDKKHVIGEYTRITLDSKQKIDVETKRQVNLRSDQKAILEKIAGGSLGHITVYNSRYNVCTCFDHTVIAIWDQKGFLDFPRNSVITLAKEKQSAEAFTDGEENDPATKTIIFIVVFDSNGDMYVKGQRIDNSKLIPWIGRLRGKNSHHARNILIVFDPPPPISAETDRKVLQQYSEVKAYCDKLGVETQDWGIEAIPNHGPN
jgi:hypothetical protein